jgi:hypothetical protein
LAASDRGVGRAGDLARQIEQALGVTVDTGHHVMLPGMKQRMAIVSFSPSQMCIGHTMVRPSRFGSLIIASSGTSYQLLSPVALDANPVMAGIAITEGFGECQIS